MKGIFKKVDAFLKTKKGTVLSLAVDIVCLALTVIDFKKAWFE